MSETPTATAALPELSGAEILEVDDIEVKRIEVPEWKSVVHLRVLPADKSLALAEKLQALPKGKVAEAMFLVLGEALVTSDKKPLFTAEQLEKVRGRSSIVLTRLHTAAMRLNFPDSEQAKNVSGGAAIVASPTA
jgi:hypothetical protein